MPDAPPTRPPLDEAAQRREAMLLEFVRDHDAPCPVCGYSVKGLTRPICPECRHELVLTVGTAKPRFGWLLPAVAPGFFSGIAAAFLSVAVIGRLFFGDGKLSPTMTAVDLFGWVSGAFAVTLCVRRRWFISMPQTRQRWWAILVWAVHIAAFALMLTVGPRYI